MRFSLSQAVPHALGPANDDILRLSTIALLVRSLAAVLSLLLKQSKWVEVVVSQTNDSPPGDEETYLEVWGQ